MRCPAIEHPDVPAADPAGLDPLLARLVSDRAVEDDEVFPLGTLRADGRVDLCKQGLGAAGAARLMPAAAASPHARHVLLGTNAIGDEGAVTVARALADTHGLHTLYLGCNRIGPDGVTALADALSADDTVRALWLKRNPVGDDGVTALAAMLRRNTALRTLDLVNTGITAASLRVLLDALTGRPHPVERLFLGGNGLTADTATLLAALIREAGVRELYLPANHLGDEGAAVLAAAAATPGTRCGSASAATASVPPEHAPSPTPWAASRRSTSDGPCRNAASAHRPTPPATTAPTPWPPRAPGSPLRRLELRHTGLTGRGAKSLLAAVPDGSPLEYVGLGPGLPRKVKRSFTRRLRPTTAAHPDLRAIGSVYR